MEKPKNKKKPSPEEKRKLTNMFLITFALLMVLFTAIGALVLDSFVQVPQFEDDTQTTGEEEKGTVDDRLRFIAMQDNDKINNIPSNIEDVDPAMEVSFFYTPEEVKNSKFTEYNEKFKKKDAQEEETTSIEGEPTEEIPFKKEPVSKSPLNIKVVIGSYNSKQEAQTALEQIKNQFSEPPFIKMYNDKFTLQVASFKTPDTANEFAKSLRNQGYYVRIIGD
ncbi:MAG: SPOR domain-containing protein [Candidatus Gastranaerophilales bacterium]|nr:SPOR domain-containing protein [Candidatus Gastranaerophilales bacterium]